MDVRSRPAHSFSGFSIHCTCRFAPLDAIAVVALPLFVVRLRSLVVLTVGVASFMLMLVRIRVRCPSSLPRYGISLPLAYLHLLVGSVSHLLMDLGLGSLDPAADYASLRRIPSLRYGGSPHSVRRSRDIDNIHIYGHEYYDDYDKITKFTSHAWTSLALYSGLLWLALSVVELVNRKGKSID